MSEEIVSAVDAAPAANVEPQSEQAQEVQTQAEPQAQAEPVKTNDAEPVEPQQAKPVQTPEENAKFAEQRRAREAAEAKATKIERDYNVAKTFGAYGVFSESDIAEKYGHLGITNYEQMAVAVRESEMKEKGVDPEIVKKYADDLPEVKEAREVKRNQEQWQEFSREFPDVKVENIPQEVLIEYGKGKPLTDAYAIYEARQTRIAKVKAQEEAAKVKANETNAQTAMGSVETSGNTDPGYISAEEFNNNRNNQEWVNKNFVKINKSMPKW
jgi:hypothetical protein